MTELSLNEYLEHLRAASSASLVGVVEEEKRLYVKVTVDTEEFLVSPSHLASLELEALAADGQICPEVFRSLVLIKKAGKEIAEKDRIESTKRYLITTYPALTNEVLDRAVSGEVFVVLRALQEQSGTLHSREAQVDEVKSCDEVFRLTNARSPREYRVFGIGDFKPSDVLLM